MQLVSFLQKKSRKQQKLATRENLEFRSQSKIFFSGVGGGQNGCVKTPLLASSHSKSFLKW